MTIDKKCPQCGKIDELLNDDLCISCTLIAGAKSMEDDEFFEVFLQALDITIEDAEEFLKKEFVDDMVVRATKTRENMDDN